MFFLYNARQCLMMLSGTCNETVLHYLFSKNLKCLKEQIQMQAVFFLHHYIFRSYKKVLNINNVAKTIKYICLAGTVAARLVFSSCLHHVYESKVYTLNTLCCLPTFPFKIMLISS